MSDKDMQSFLGFERRDGRPGVRNHVVILSISGLEHATARAIQALCPATILIASTYGRGHIGEDLLFQRHMMKALATHPNVAGALVLGPDDNLVNAVGDAMEAAGREWHGLSLQACHEDRFAMIEQGARMAARIQHRVSRMQRKAQPMSALAIAIECGHSDATSGLVANPLAGDLACWLVHQGGQAVFSETLEWIGTEAILSQRAATPAVADAVLQAIERRKAAARAAGQDVQANNPGPQNHDGGITTLEEKSLGAIAKGGDQPIVGFLREGDALPDDPGLYLMDTPTFSPESITSMISTGAQIVLFTTGQGNPYGSALAPTIKISANPDTVGRVAEQIDIDASAVLDGTATKESLVPLARDTFLEIANGALTWSEVVGEKTESISRLTASI